LLEFVSSEDCWSSFQVKKAIREQAQKLIRDHGDAAYQKAQEAVRAAHRRRNGRLERYLTNVAREIARRNPETLAVMR
jgi:hypothetical protein